MHRALTTRQHVNAPTALLASLQIISIGTKQRAKKMEQAMKQLLAGGRESEFALIIL
jgi:hypothetical protein